jgi:hypothetical protein
VAKARKGSRKSASRAKGKKSASKKKKAVLDLKKLRRDILRAKKILTKRHERAAAKLAPSAAAPPEPTAYSVFDRWTQDIDMLCNSGEPCGPDMVIS